MKESYSLTPKGLIQMLAHPDVWDDIELHCYRHGFNAILINKEGGRFIKVELSEKKGPKDKRKR